jgi:UDP-4-amino-4,6-dideoxy-N-acetyl-beta-L-altrosamine N-acetyltransferase
MILEGYNIRLIRLTKDDAELVRHWRNSESIQKYMNYRDHITKEMQEKWFVSVDTIYHNYFIIEYKNEKIGLINGSEIDWENGVTKNGGIFLWNLNYPEAALSASLLLTDASFILGFKETYIKNLKTNLKAIEYNLALGYKQLPDDDVVFFKFVLTENNYKSKTDKLKNALFSKEDQILKFHFNDLSHPVTKIFYEKVKSINSNQIIIVANE